MTSSVSKPFANHQTRQAFVNWFRDSSPYIHSHRESTFVIFFGGEAVLDEYIENHVHDFALLSSLGIRLVLVHGIRPQIDSRLKAQNHTTQFHNRLRITDDVALQCAKESAGTVRVELEALLSMGLSNSPMSGAKVRVVSGNFITAKPLGIIDGIDFIHTGEVRRIDSAGIKFQLKNNHVVLISPIGYSPSGEMFNLCAEKVATEIAIELKAEKLILMAEQECVDPETGSLIAQITTAEASRLIAEHPDLPETMTQTLSAAIQGCQAGIERTHILKRTVDGGLLQELFSRNGIGTLISLSPYEELRTASLNDIAGILELIKPLEHQGILIKRSRERLEIEIEDYTIIERDGLIIACTALHRLKTAGEIACLAVHPDYRDAGRGYRLLEDIQHRAEQAGLEKLYVLSTQTMAWFLEHGFLTTTLDTMPESLRLKYNNKRNSKVLCKKLLS
jgi:amino-acid N-acetyltransferase